MAPLLDSGLNVGPHRRRRYVAPAPKGGGGSGLTFDPAEHTIPEVVAHAETLDSNGVIALVALEREGKGRSTLLAKLGELLEAARLAESDDEADDGDVEGPQEPAGGPETGDQDGSLGNPLDDEGKP